MPKPYTPNDRLSRKAKYEGYKARSVYKLEEIDRKYKLLSPNLRVIDIGAAPGSWLQYVSEKIKPEGWVLGFDLKEIEPINSNVLTKVCDVSNLLQVKKYIDELGWKKVDLILSDIAPNTTGIKYVDQKKSIELSKNVFELAREFLKPSGKLVMKIFPGEDFDRFLAQLKKHFKIIHVMKVEASRDRSREVYIICW